MTAALRSAGLRFGPPLVALLLQRLVVVVTAWVAGYNPFAPSSWVRWDSGHYLGIAAGGYQAPAHCTAESGYGPAAWCGNTAWFPGFPWAMRLLAQTGLPLEAAGVLVALVGQVGCLLLIWESLRKENQWPSLVLGAFFPGNIYLVAVFPVSSFLLAAIATILLCEKDRFAAAAVCAALAAICYPTGVLLGFVVAAWALLHRRWRALEVLPGAALGYVLVFAAMRREAGSWDAFFRVQAHYSYRVGAALDTLFSRLKPIVNRRYRDAKGFVTALQTLLTTALMAMIGGRLRETVRTMRPPLPLVYLLAFWLTPLAMGGDSLSLYRSEALLLPAVFLVPAFSRRVQYGLLVLAIALTVAMTVLFLQSVLV
jgi:Gpi18-like mannosyltransferase